MSQAERARVTERDRRKRRGAEEEAVQMVRVTNREVSKASESNKDRDTETKKQRCVERPTGGTDGEKAGGLGWGMSSQCLPGTVASVPQPSLATGDLLATLYRALPKNGSGQSGKTSWKWQ